MTLVDTSVLLDVLYEGAAHGNESEARLAAALRAESLGINEIIAAELAPVFDSEAELWSALKDAQVRLVPFPRAGVYIAGQAFLKYRRRGGKRQRILPDFMIGAHAVAGNARLLTRGLRLGP